MNYFFYNPATQFDNMGDLLINKSLISLLRAHGKVIINDHNKPEWFIDELKEDGDEILSDLSKDTSFTFLQNRLRENKEMNKKDNYFLVFVPGDMARRGFKKALISVRYYYSLRNLKRLGCKLMRVGVSLGNFDVYNFWSESLYTRNYAVYGIRDKASLALASRYKFANTLYFPDLAWAYRPKLIERAAEVKGKYILISFRANRSGTTHNSDFFSGIKNHLFAVLSHTSFDNYKIVVSYQVQYDREAAQELVDLFSSKFEVEFIDRLLSLDEAIHLYAYSDLVISNRLHVLLLGSICKTLSIPFINPLDNKKIVGIYEDNAIYDIVLDYRNSVTEVSDKLVDLVERRDVIMDRLEDKHKNNAYIIENVIKDIVNNKGGY